MDGCSTLRLFWHVVLPAARPAAAVLGLFTFMQAWNDFFWPLVVLTPENPTVQVALAGLGQQREGGGPARLQGVRAALRRQDSTSDRQAAQRDRKGQHHRAAARRYGARSFGRAHQPAAAIAVAAGGCVAKAGSA